MRVGVYFTILCLVKRLRISSDETKQNFQYWSFVHFENIPIIWTPLCRFQQSLDALIMSPARCN